MRTQKMRRSYESFTSKVSPRRGDHTCVCANDDHNHCHAADSLPSWNDVAAKKSVVEFVAKVTKEGGADFVPPAERIAVFDNDGTL